MDSIEKVKDTLYRALDKVSNEQLTSSSLDNIFKIVGSLYKLEKMPPQEEGYSMDGYSRARGRGARRDSMGRYSREGSNAYYRDGGSNDYSRGSNDYSRGSNDYSGGYSREGSYAGGYSNHNKQEVIQELREMMSDVKDDQAKQALQRCLQQLEN